MDRRRTNTPGVPYQLIRASKGHTVEVETSSGDSFSGHLYDVEENLTLSLTDVNATFVDGKTAKMEGVYLKGSQLRLIKLPDGAKKNLYNLSRPRGGGGGGHSRRY